MSEEIGNKAEAVRLFGVYSAGRFDPWALSGDGKATCRMHVLSVLLGVNVKRRLATVGRMRDALCHAVGASGNCEAARESDLRSKCKLMMSSPV